MQTRVQSFIEAWTNIFVGYGVAFLTQILIFPLLGIRADIVQNLQIGLVFTAVSLIRSYSLRRLFNKWHR